MPRSVVKLSAELARRLGLGDQATSVRPLGGSDRMVLLERIGEPGGAVPWDRDLMLSADVRSFSLADVLQMLHQTRKSGFLHFEQGSCAKSVYFHAGEVVFAASNQVIDRLGESLVRAGLLDPARHRTASAAYRLPGHYGRFLVERGDITPSELWYGVKFQVEEIVRSLFAYGAGHVFFWEGEIRPDNVVRLSLPTARLIDEGLEQRDALLVFQAQLEDRRVRLEAVPREAGRLDTTSASVVSALGGVKSFRELCGALDREPLPVARTLRLLEQLGAVKVVRGGFRRDGVSEEDELRACVRSHVKLLSELVAPIVAMEGPDPMRARLSEVAEEAAERHSELLAGLHLGHGGLPDPEQLIERALRFPGDRERAVREALGELVAYAEFELLNHPRVRDAETFLDTLDLLRAEL